MLIDPSDTLAAPVASREKSIAGEERIGHTGATSIGLRSRPLLVQPELTSWRILIHYPDNLLIGVGIGEQTPRDGEQLHGLESIHQTDRAGESSHRLLHFHLANADRPRQAARIPGLTQALVERGVAGNL